MNKPIYKYTNKPIPNETQKSQFFFSLSKLLPLIGLLALLVYWFIGLLSNIHAQSQEPLRGEPGSVSEHLRLEEYACNAKDPPSFKACIEEARKTAMPFIKIIAPIICDSRSDCTFEIKNINTPLIISSSKPENKFLRREDYGYPFLVVEDSSKIEFRDLYFEDEGINGCFLGSRCEPFFMVRNASDIKVNKVSFLRIHGPSLLITSARNIEVINSTFKGSFRTGLEVLTEGFTQNIKIESNTFDSNAGSGLIFQARSLAGQSSIKSNTFLNNHSGGAYYNCTYPCTGAQIKIPGPTSNLRVSQNKISGGANTALDSLGLFASGIEISGSDLSSTSLFCNEISGNRGSGIVQTGPFRNIQNVTVSENKIWGNGLNLNTPAATADENNCYTQECSLSCMDNR